MEVGDALYKTHAAAHLKCTVGLTLPGICSWNDASGNRRIGNSAVTVRQSMNEGVSTRNSRGSTGGGLVDEGEGGPVCVRRAVLAYRGLMCVFVYIVGAEHKGDWWPGLGKIV